MFLSEVVDISFIYYIGFKLVLTGCFQSASKSLLLLLLLIASQPRLSYILFATTGALFI